MRLNVLLPIAAAALCAAACASVDDSFSYARDVGSQELTRSGDDHGEVTIVWRFGPPDWVTRMCRAEPKQKGVFGCSMRDAGSTRCLVIAVEPHDFKDFDRLAVLGHEAWHCMGARHT
jgi:hypothetical protein